MIEGWDSVNGVARAVAVTPEGNLLVAGGERRIRIERCPAGVDLNGDTMQYWHATNGKVDLWIDGSAFAGTWAMDTQAGVDGLAANCLTWEPYAHITGGSSQAGPFNKNTEAGAIVPGPCNWGGVTPNAELAMHGANNFMSLVSGLRVFKTAEDAMADVAGTGLTGDSKPRLRNPIGISPSVETMVMMRQRILFPFQPFAGAYPAIRFKVGGSLSGVTLTGGKVVAGYGSDGVASNTGALSSDAPPDSWPVGYGKSPWVGDPYNGGSYWTDAGVNITGMVFDWPYESGPPDEAVHVEIYIPAEGLHGTGWSLDIATFPGPNGPWSNFGAGSTPMASLVAGQWNAIALSANRLRRGTNVILLHTSSGSSTKYFDIGGDKPAAAGGAGSIVTKVPLKNYVLHNFDTTAFWAGHMQNEYWQLFRDYDKITTWSVMQSGTAHLDFIGAALGNMRRKPAGWDANYRDGWYDPAIPFDLSVKRDSVPNRMVSEALGTVNLGDEGYSAGTDAINQSDLDGVWDGVADDNRKLIFSHAGRFPIEWTFEAPATNVIDAAPSIRALPDSICLPNPVDEWSSALTGWNHAWTDTPDALTTAIDANTKRTIRITADYSGFRLPARVQLMPAAPTGLVATVISSSEIGLVWIDNSTNEYSFIVERGDSADGPFAPIATLAANSESYSDTGLTASATYYYRICAYTDMLKSYSDVVTVSTPAQLIAYTRHTIGSGAGNEVDYIDITGTGGYWTITQTLTGPTTSGHLAPNISTADLATAINAILAEASLNGVTVTGTPGSHYAVEFVADLSGQEVPVGTLTVDGLNLTP